MVTDGHTSEPQGVVFLGQLTLDHRQASSLVKQASVLSP
jgi:hypothetical protein